MTSILEKDWKDINMILESIKNQSLQYIQNLSNRKTSVFPALGVNIDRLPENGLGLEQTLKTFNTIFEPLIVASSGPRYLGFVTGGSTPASIAGDWLATVYDQNTQSNNGLGDVSAIIELETIKLFRQLLELPDEFSGGFVTGATMSNFTCLAVARQWFGKQFGKDFAKNGVDESISLFASTPHSSVVKSLSMLGIGSRNIEIINAISGRERLDIEDLKIKIDGLAGKPFILCTSAGTVNTVDFDNFKAISELRQTYNFWWHIDGAFGAMVACSPIFKHLLDAWDLADSITIDCHKWLNVPYENAIFLVRNEHSQLQVETFQNTNVPYLGENSSNFNYLNFLPENSRRLKALPVLFTLMAYGKNGYQSIVENSVQMAKSLSDYIEHSKYFELLAETRLNNVCFTLKNNSDQSTEFLNQLNSRGKVFMTPTIFNQKKGIRVSFVNWLTNAADIKIILQEMEETYNSFI